MTPEQVQMVKESWAKVEPISDDAAALFYGRLFEIAPPLKDLFANANMEEQGKKLMQTLAIAVASLDRLEEIMPAVTALAARHSDDYGVKPDDYQPVGEALLWTLGQGLGDDFTPEVEAAWTEVYTTLSTAMIESTAAT